MKAIELQLSEAIESSVERIVSASHAAAVAALDRAFGRGTAPARRTAALGRRSTSPRRSTEQITELGQRFLEVVRDEPGQAMAVLAPKLGVLPAELQFPVVRLKKEGLIRTAGQRQFKRYFPVEDTEIAGVG